MMLIGKILIATHIVKKYQTTGVNKFREMDSCLLAGLMKPVKGEDSENSLENCACHHLVHSLFCRRHGSFLHKCFLSKHLVNLVNNLNFSVSYNCKYKVSMTPQKSK